jgi:hypothetical protein
VLEREKLWDGFCRAQAKIGREADLESFDELCQVLEAAVLLASLVFLAQEEGGIVFGIERDGSIVVLDERRTDHAA